MTIDPRTAILAIATRRHAALVTAVTERLELAQGVEIPDDWVSYRWQDVDNGFIAANDPATVIRHCERDLRILERHRPRADGECSTCLVDVRLTYQGYRVAYRDGWPCDEINDLAVAYGINDERQEEEGTMTKEELAEKAYRTWDDYGGRALGAWGAPHVLEAWLEVVQVVLFEAVQGIPMENGQ
mgnify:CR=1 FL=1